MQVLVRVCQRGTMAGPPLRDFPSSQEKPEVLRISAIMMPVIT